VERSTTAAAGWSDLGEARWEAARASFEAAVAERETPESLEGLSWAAWWLDDADAVFSARERAYALYRERGDAASAARMATWLGADQLDFRGAASVARGWLARARRLLEPLEPGPEHGWLAFHEGYVAGLAGDGETSAERGEAAAEAGRRHGVPDLEMLGLALLGAALVADAEVEEGMRRLDEATAVALQGEAAIPISAAWTCCFLVSSCTRVLDFERAAEWCDRIAEFAERYGSRFMLAFCRSEYGTVALWRGRFAEAEALLEAAAGDYARSRPAMASAPLAALAEVRRRQGRPAEAKALAERAGAAALLCRAWMALDEGDAAGAAEAAERVLRGIPADSVVARAPALVVACRARAALGDGDDAALAAASLARAATLAGTDAMTALALSAEAAVASSEGRHEQARALFEDAADHFEAAGAVYDSARARLDLAAELAALGRPDHAAVESRAARSRLSSLGARPEPPLPEITPREREVVGLLAEGLTNAQIAERLVLSEHTVHRHVANILRKLDVPTRAAAAARAARAGALDELR